MLNLSGYTLLHHLLLDIYFGLYSGLMGVTIGFIARRLGAYSALLSAPFLWIIYEYLRSNAFFLALPWPLLAHTQYDHPQAIQLAAVTGTYGVSFLIVLVNSAMAGMILHSLQFYKLKGRSHTDPISRGRGIRLLTAVAVVIAAFTLSYGYTSMNDEVSGPEIKVAMVQGNIEQHRKWDPEFGREIMDIYTSLSRQAADSRPALIVWPETATPRSVMMDEQIYRQVQKTAVETGAYLLLGSAQVRKINVKDLAGAKYANSAFMFAPEATYVKPARYDKMRLLPFGEYLPMSDRIPWSTINIPEVKGFLPGKDFAIFDIPGARFAAPICWENIFPEIIRNFVLNGAEFLVNITNEAWFGRTAAPYQFLSMSVFRAVENRRFVLRCANTGVTCVIDPFGRITNRVRNERGDDIFVRGVIVDSITPIKTVTIFTRFGDWFVLFCILVSAAFLIRSVLNKRSVA